MKKNKEIKLNERLSIQHDSNGGWRLHEKTTGINQQTQQPTEGRNTTYHGSLCQVFSSAIEKEAGLAKDLGEITKIIHQLKRNMRTVIEFMLTPKNQ